MKDPTASSVERSGEEPAERTKVSLATALRELAGVDATRCYQCGKCTAGCPMASEMTLRTHQMIRLVQLDLADRLFADDSMWLCLTCETCTARCPNQVDPARLVDGLRELALREGKAAPKAIGAFHRAFLDQIHKRGRLSEIGLMATYKLTGGSLFADVGLAPLLMAKGKLPLSSPRVRGIKALRKLMDACEKQEEQP